MADYYVILCNVRYNNIEGTLQNDKSDQRNLYRFSKIL